MGPWRVPEYEAENIGFDRYDFAVRRLGGRTVRGRTCRRQHRDDWRPKHDGNPEPDAGHEAADHDSRIRHAERLGRR